MEEVFHIAPADLDVAGSVMVIRMLDHMQRLADVHANVLGVGREDLQKKNLVWMSARSAILIKREIHQNENITIKTWTGRNTHASCPRYFTFIDEAGTDIGGGATIWMLIDPQSRKIVSPHMAGLPEIYVPSDMEPITVSPIPKLSRIDIQEMRIPKYTDIDINGHVNNVRYVNWVLDALPIQQMQNYFVSALQVNYRQEIKPENVCMLEIQTDDSDILAVGKSEHDRSFFEARIQLEKRK